MPAIRFPVSLRLFFVVEILLVFTLGFNRSSTCTTEVIVINSARWQNKRELVADFPGNLHVAQSNLCKTACLLKIREVKCSSTRLWLKLANNLSYRPHCTTIRIRIRKAKPLGTTQEYILNCSSGTFRIEITGTNR